MSNYQKGEPVWATIGREKIAATVLEHDAMYGYRVKLHQANPWYPDQVWHTVHPQWLPYNKLAGRETRITK